MIFLTVGTQLPFDRLVKSLDHAIERNGMDEEIFAQVGNSSYWPQNFEAVSFLEQQLYDKYFREASCVISHAGIGTISMAMEYEKPLLVMPREQRYGEVVNNHQIDIAKVFEERGYILVAYEAETFRRKIEQLKTFVPCKRVPQPWAVVERIAGFLNELTVQSEKL